MSTYNEMKKKAESDQNRIELRSEKVRNMIGEMPSFLIRWGNTILVVIRAAGFDCLVCIFQEMNVGISSVFLIFVF